MPVHELRLVLVLYTLILLERISAQGLSVRWTTVLEGGLIVFNVAFCFFVYILGEEIHLLQLVSRLVILSLIHFKLLFLLFSGAASLSERIRHSILVRNLEAAIVQMRLTIPVCTRLLLLVPIVTIDALTYVVLVQEVGVRKVRALIRVLAVTTRKQQRMISCVGRSVLFMVSSRAFVVAQQRVGAEATHVDGAAALKCTVKHVAR